MEHFDIVVVGAGWHGLAMTKTYLEACPDANLLIVDSAASIGGTWAQERLYPGLKTNNLVGSYEFGDFPMNVERFGVKPGQHIPGQVVHDYLVQFAKHFGLMSHMRLRQKVESAELQDDGEWLLQMTPVDRTESKTEGIRIIAKKLVVATGLTSEPFIPKFVGQESFNRKHFHAKQLRHQAQGLENAKQVVVLGGNKSSWDTCYFAANTGAHVHMVMRPGGGGPSWVWPVFFYPFQVSIQKLATTRLSTWFDPCIWSENTGPVSWIRYMLHKTFIGRLMVSAFWNMVGSFANRAHRYDDHPETRKLKPWTSPFWMGNSLSIHNYATPWFDLVRKGKISVHIADIERLSEGIVHLSTGESLEVDALVCCTGWKTLPPIRFLPQGLTYRLGLRDRDAENSQLVAKARVEVLSKLPSFQEPIQRIWPAGPLPSKIDNETRKGENNSRYQLYRFLVPPDEMIFANRNIAFIGAHLALAATMVAQVQALWVTAYFLDKIPNLHSTQINYDRIRYETVLHNEYTRIRHPHAAGGVGERVPDLAFDCLSYVDLLLDDLAMVKYRKGGIWSEMTGRYFPNDYKGLVQEWRRQVSW